MALVGEDHDYKTLIVDTVTQLEVLFTNYIVDNDLTEKDFNE